MAGKKALGALSAAFVPRQHLAASSLLCNTCYDETDPSRYDSVDTSRDDLRVWVRLGLGWCRCCQTRVEFQSRSPGKCGSCCG